MKTPEDLINPTGTCAVQGCNERAEVATVWSFISPGGHLGVLKDSFCDKHARRLMRHHRRLKEGSDEA